MELIQGRMALIGYLGHKEEDWWLGDWPVSAPLAGTAAEADSDSTINGQCYF